LIRHDARNSLMDWRNSVLSESKAAGNFANEPLRQTNRSVNELRRLDRE
jgi:hypothetical protein